MKNGNKEEVVRGVTEEVRGVSSVTYDLTLVCKGGATVRKIHQNNSFVFLSPSYPPGGGLQQASWSLESSLQIPCLQCHHHPPP